MRCFKCDTTFEVGVKCPNCGSDMSILKWVRTISDKYYNIGLDKAKVRDLTGAVESLKLSLAVDKNNVQARNLLGLVYCEMGDIVEALTQWVVSKNIQPTANIAEVYIKQVQSNQNKFEIVTSTIKKYNLSLRYVVEENYDMAEIQLKKVLSQNPKLIKAQQLLALLYIRGSNYSRAKKLLNAILNVDHNNTLALRYLKEINGELPAKKKETTHKKRVVVENKPLNGNEAIIPRSSYKEPSNGAITVINILVGIVIGAALIWFLILPSRNQGIMEEKNREIRELSEQLSSGNVELNSLEAQLKVVTSERDSLQERLDQIGGTDGNNKLLTAVIDSANYYIANQKTQAAEAIADIDVSSLPTEGAKALYNTLSEETMINAATDLYNQGMTAYYRNDFEKAIDFYTRSFKCDKTKVDAIYYMAKSYESLADVENAKQYYNQIVNDFNTSRYVAEAETYVNSH